MHLLRKRSWSPTTKETEHENRVLFDRTPVYISSGGGISLHLLLLYILLLTFVAYNHLCYLTSLVKTLKARKWLQYR